MAEVRPRRPQTWAVVELTRTGERKVEDGTIAPLLREALMLPPNHPVFVPSRTYTSGGRRVTVHLMEGYVFVGSDGSELPIVFRSNQPYVKRMLTIPTPSGSRVLSVVSDTVVLDMEASLAKHVGEDVSVGSHVTITSGVYAKMEGEVIETSVPNRILVRLRMRSLDAIVEIPRSFAVPCDGSE
jgi:transcription antitermination factor NusG